MSPQVILITAISSLASNKLRAGLTVLGIVIGVAAVISLLSIGRGAQDAITERIQSLGTNLLFVRPGGTTLGGVFGGQGSASTSNIVRNLEFQRDEGSHDQWVMSMTVVVFYDEPEGQNS